MKSRDQIADQFDWTSSESTPVEWEVTEGLVPYPLALERMELEAEAIARGEQPERVWLLEHPPLFTAGTSAVRSDLIDADRFPVYATGRGGQYTYHGPGQRVVYVMLDLSRRRRDVRGFVSALEEVMINALKRFGIHGERREDRVGIWVERPDKGDGCEDKIGAIGIRLRKWVSFHGLSINVAPDLEHYSGIVACGVREHGQTSLRDLGVYARMDEVDEALRHAFEGIFGRTVCAGDKIATAAI